MPGSVLALSTSNDNQPRVAALKGSSSGASQNSAAYCVLAG